MVLVDTSVWVTHLREGTSVLENLLNDGRVVCHPFVIGGLACGNLKNRGRLKKTTREDEENENHSQKQKKNRPKRQKITRRTISGILGLTLFLLFKPLSLPMADATMRDDIYEVLDSCTHPSYPMEGEGCEYAMKNLSNDLPRPLREPLDCLLWGYSCPGGL